ncbi:MAG: hydrolase [Christensenellaceae bacterium]|jgi:hypothetical protein
MAVKEVDSPQHYSIVEVPEAIEEVAGIRLFGRVIKSIIFTTDIALINNNNADAVMAVHPFTPQAAVNRKIIEIAKVPVFCGINGMHMSSKRLVKLSRDAEFSGAAGLIIGPDVEYEAAAKIKLAVDIPVIATVVSVKEDVERKFEAGADMLNVSGAEETCAIIENIRKNNPYVPIIATGGPTDDTLKETIACGADAITFTPPTNAEIFKKQMQAFRDSLNGMEEAVADE